VLLYRNNRFPKLFWAGSFRSAFLIAKDIRMNCIYHYLISKLHTCILHTFFYAALLCRCYYICFHSKKVSYSFGYLYCLFKFVHCYWFMLVYAFSLFESVKTIFYFYRSVISGTAVDTAAFKSCKKFLYLARLP
jgi:hypothetical protein